MDCLQCEQTLDGGWTTAGVCGKDPNLDSVPETMILGAKGGFGVRPSRREMGYVDESVDATVHETLFHTLTTVNFDVEETIGQFGLRPIGTPADDLAEMLGEPVYIVTPFRFKRDSTKRRRERTEKTVAGVPVFVIRCRR